MKCIKCGIQFSEADIMVMEEHDLQICDSCELKTELFLITNAGVKFAVEGENPNEALQNWGRFAMKMGFIHEDELATIQVEPQIIEHVILVQD
ncbi:hypothetical protein [Sporosarcina sp. FSL K6-2383]|uniref:hypothetical protein n=1 Tax=Sporosarcina sp. FSL K6-2383 TaxID=2921556 RepID=UPI00315AB280